MVRTKVFVGNLSFTTKETELAKEFEVAGKVISANIITRGPRSLGYGFVEMENEADAENAVKLLDKKEIDGRPINVEVAKPREETAQGQDQSQNQGAPSNRGGNRGGRGGARRGGVRGGRGGSRGGQGGNQGQQQQGQGQQQGQQQAQQGQQGQGQPRRGGSRGGSRGGAPRGGAQRAPKAEGEDNRTPSTTTLFVANLPFSLEDDGFAKVLKDNSLAYKTAHVVKKKTGRSKGFGFIEFENEADQQKALASLHGKPIDSRDLVVKVALQGQRADEASTPADAVSPTNKPSAVKAAVNAAATAPSPSSEKKDDKTATPQKK